MNQRNGGSKRIEIASKALSHHLLQQSAYLGRRIRELRSRDAPAGEFGFARYAEFAYWDRWLLPRPGLIYVALVKGYGLRIGFDIDGNGYDIVPDDSAPNFSACSRVVHKVGTEKPSQI